jgi:hypothetical protein
VPGLVLLAVLIVTVELAELPDDKVTLVGASEELSPLPVPALASRLIVPANPFRLVSVMVETTEAPCWTVMLVGFDAIEKSGVGGGELTMNCPVIALR